MQAGRISERNFLTAGFTIMEVVLALAVLSITMGPLLSAFYFFSSSSSSSNHKMAMTTLAEDVLSEIVSRNFRDPGCPFEFGSEEKEKDAGDPKRILFNDIDDYCDYQSGDCPEDLLGNKLTAYSDFEVEVSVTLTYRQQDKQQPALDSVTTLTAPYIIGETIEFEGVGKPWGLAVSEYGDSVYVSLEAADRVVHVQRVYDQDQDRYRHQVNEAVNIDTGDDPRGLALSPLEDELYVAASGEAEDAFYAFALDELVLGGTTLEVGENPERIVCVRPSSDDILAYVTVDDQTDPKEPKVVKVDLTEWPPRVDGTIDLNGRPGDMVASPKGDRVFLCVDESGSGKVLCIDPGGTEKKLSESFKFPMALAVDSRGEVLFVVEQTMVTAYTIPDENQAAKYTELDSEALTFSGNPSAAARSPDDGCLVAASGSTLMFIDISQTAEKYASRKLYTDEEWKIEGVDTSGTLKDLAFSPSGDRLYAASYGDDMLYILEDARIAKEVKVYVSDNTKQCREIMLTTTVYK